MISSISSWMTNAAGVCTAETDLHCAAAVPSLLSPVYPMTFAKLPNLGVLVLLVWATLALILMRRRAAGSDLQYDQRRARAALDAVSQVCAEHKGNEAKRVEYEAREAKVRAAARERASKQL